MKYSKDKQEAIRHYILELIQQGRKGIASKTADEFSVSEMTVYRYLQNLQEEGVIVKCDHGYQLVSKYDIHAIRVGDMREMDEDLVCRKYVDPWIADLEENVRRIWVYCFTEMMNNVIEHAKAGNALIILESNYLSTSIAIFDDGIGIFEHIRSFFGYASLEEAIAELFKGKLTTDKDNHSGEGIFFVSHLCDSFAVVSDHRVFTRNKYTEWIKDLTENPQIMKQWHADTGTAIFMRLSNFTHKKVKEVFDRFSDEEGGFIRTTIPMHHFFDTYPVSRSQARRLSQRFESFKEVILDFKDVEEIGQGFAHELFSKYVREHPNIQLIPQNTNMEIDKMLRHVGFSGNGGSKL